MSDIYHLSTSHGLIVAEEAGRGDLPVLLIHGNSLSREVFRKQLGGALSRKYRLVTFDLPGHGDSSDALRRCHTYTLPGLADAATEALDLLGIREVVVVGWSLGGHIALEIVAQFSGIKGLLISGAPPVSRHNMAQGFIPTPHTRLAGQQYLGPSEIDGFGEAIFGAPLPVAFRSAIERADGLARKTIFEAARSGVGIDQRCLVEYLAIPLAVVNGAEDPFINLDYFEVPKYANLWKGQCHSLPGLKHAPFWEAPDVFDELLGRFIDDVCATTWSRQPVASGVHEASATTATHRCRNAELRDHPSIPNSIPSIGRYTTSLARSSRSASAPVNT
jgi:pimeloyl-ACP methyl ester carboxylesterase